MPPLSIDLSKLVLFVFVSWKRIAYLPPNYSRNIVVARVGSTANLFLASPSNGGGTLSKACLRSREAMPILQLCAVDDRFLRTVDISFALRPPIHPSGLPMLLTQSTSSARCGRSARHPYSAIVLCVQVPLVRPLRCVMGLDFGSNTMMYHSHDPCVWSKVSQHEGRDGCLYISPWSWSKILRSHRVHSNRFLHQERGTTLLNHGHSDSRRFQPVHSRRLPR